MHEPQDTKKRILQTAIDLISTKGFTGTSIRDIANTVDMSISTIYHYFGSKSGLMLAILEHSALNISVELHEIAEAEMSPLDRFKLLVDTHLRLGDLHRKESRIFFLNEEDLSPEGNKFNRKIQREILDIYLKVLGALESSGEIQSRNLTILAFNIFGVINWQLRWYRPRGDLSRKKINREILSFILNGVLGSAGVDLDTDVS